MEKKIRNEFFVKVSALVLTWDIGAYDTRQEALAAIEADKKWHEETGNRSAYRYDYEIIERISRDEVQL